MKNKKIKKIIAAAIFIFSAAAMSVPAGAMYIGDKTPAFDISDVVTAYKQTSAKAEFYTDIDGNKLDGWLYCDFSGGDYNEFSNEYTLGGNLLLVKFEDGKAVKSNYTGFTKSDEGRRYYLNGRRFYGWQKIKGAWYHFDLKTGVADTGKVTIGGGKYTFDKNGKWTGKVTKSGLVPSDFSLRFISNSNFGFDTAERKIYFGDTEIGVAERDIKISKLDLQALYSIYTESGFKAGETKDFGQKYLDRVCADIEETLHEDVALEWYNTEPETYFTATAKNGGEAKVIFSNDTEQIAHIDDAAFRAFRMNSCYYRYLLGLEYKYPYMGEYEIFGID